MKRYLSLQRCIWKLKDEFGNYILVQVFISKNCKLTILMMLEGILLQDRTFNFSVRTVNGELFFEFVYMQLIGELLASNNI